MKKKLLLLFLLLLILFGTYYLLSNLNPSMPLDKEKALTKILGRAPNLNDKTVISGQAEHKGKYMSFLYPKAAKIYYQTVNGQRVGDKGALDYFAYDMQAPRMIFTSEALTVSSVQTKLEDSTGVRLRQSQKELYTEAQVALADGTKGLSYIKTGNDGEISGFFFVNNRYYTVAITGSSMTDMKDLFNKTILSLKLY
jgi:hypothetical protein